MNSTLPLHNASGSITTGGAAQTVVGANDSRIYLLFQNISDSTMWLDFGVDAKADQPSIKLVADAVLVFEGKYCPRDAVSVFCATTGKKYVCRQAG